MKCKFSLFLFLLLLSGLCTLTAQSLEELGTGRIVIKEIIDIGEAGLGAMSVSWSANGQQLLFDKKQDTAYYGLYSYDLTNKKLSLLADTNLTDGRQVNSASPNMSKDGKYTLFAAQRRHTAHYSRSGPGYGLHNDVWMMNNDSERTFRLVDVVISMSNPRGSLYPYFSNDGSKLLWTAVLGQARSGSVLGRRDIFIADLNLRGRRPAAKNVLELNIGKQNDFCECYGFTPDDKQILLAANLEERQPWYGADLYLYNLNDKTLIKLTDVSGVFTRFASMSPKGEKIVWSSSMGLTQPYLGVGGSLWEKYLSSELWLMNKDGSEKRRLTFFNQRASRHFTGVRSVVGMSAWHPEGEKIAVVLLKEGRNYELESSLLILELADAYTNRLR
ncbi:MAG: hypothetical protein GX946_10810 [Oligosphaeraceae bacterium]|nr:hypothetical protein [Oligosphaeraceae bacterium]